MISVVIPIYSMEPYLRCCLDSVLSSTYRDFELILINDGSTDDSPDICREYASKDSRIHFLSQHNKGVSNTRNRGLDVCRGEWVVFIDADDLISPDFLGFVAREEYLDQDLLLFDFAHTEKELTTAHPIPEALHFGPENVPKLLRSLLLQQQLVENRNLNLLSPCGKAYRKEVIERHALRFSPDLSYGEDQLFNTEYLTKIKRCIYLPVPVYYYNIYQSSSSHRFEPNHIFVLGRMLMEIEAALNKEGFRPLLEDDFFAYVKNVLSHFLWLVAFSPFNPRPFQEKCQLCLKLKNTELFKQALMYRPVGDTSIQRWTTRVLFFLFRTQQYFAINFLTRINLALLAIKKPNQIKEMRNSKWFP